MAHELLIDEPLRIAAVEHLQWDMEADVVVVGFGGAGAAAALEAREQGADVLVVDRFDGGGATAYSGGIYYAGCTRYQKENGFDDTPEEMFKYLKMEIGDAVRDSTLRRFCEESAATVEWLEKHGVRFDGAFFDGKSSYPPEDKYLYYSGNEKNRKYSRIARPAPRGLRTCAKGWSGYAFFGALKNAVDKSDIRQKTHARAQQMVIGADGRVVGVSVLAIPEREQKSHQALYRKIDPMKPFGFRKSNTAIAACEQLERSVAVRQLVRARGGVVMATGGFAYNLDMLQQYLPDFADKAPALIRLGSMGDDGSGIRLIKSAGGALGRMDRPYAGSSISPPFSLLTGIIVNRRGRRFVNEDIYTAYLGESIAGQEGGVAWLILNGRTFRQVIRGLMPRGDGNFMNWYLPILLNILLGGTRRDKSLSGLAGKCSIDGAGLESQMAEYNEMAASGQPDPLEKLPEYIKPLRTDGAYYAVNVSMGNPTSFMLFFTLGGAQVDEETGAAVDAGGHPVAGLYAAGSAAVGIPSNGYYASGLSLSDGIFSGRRAGRHCALGTGASQC